MWNEASKPTLWRWLEWADLHSESGFTQEVIHGVFGDQGTKTTWSNHVQTAQCGLRSDHSNHLLEVVTILLITFFCMWSFSAITLPCKQKHVVAQPLHHPVSDGIITKLHTSSKKNNFFSSFIVSIFEVFLYSGMAWHINTFCWWSCGWSFLRKNLPATVGHKM